MITPWAVDGNGERQYLCKQYPAILDLLLRGFAPKPLRKLFAKRLARYELRGVTENEPVTDVTIASGCFMFLRRSVLQTVGFFDPRYFLYFEDFDLSLRVARASTITYLPNVRIVHHGGGAAEKALRHVFLFARSALTFFRTHSWKWL
jgi:GT2 family glycosyltransferase